MAYNPDDNVRQMRNEYFQARRGDATQNANVSAQQGEDAINRRFAAMGARGSGAEIAALQKNREAANAAQRQGMQDVNSQELQVREGDAQKSFQTGLADKDMDFKQRLSDREQGNKLREFDLAEKQQQLDAETTAFNKEMAMADSKKKNPGLLGMGGTLGTGIGGEKGFLGTGLLKGDK